MYLSGALMVALYVRQIKLHSNTQNRINTIIFFFKGIIFTSEYKKYEHFKQVCCTVFSSPKGKLKGGVLLARSNFYWTMYVGLSVGLRASKTPTKTLLVMLCLLHFSFKFF